MICWANLLDVKEVLVTSSEDVVEESDRVTAGGGLYIGT